MLDSASGGERKNGLGRRLRGRGGSHLRRRIVGEHQVERERVEDCGRGALEQTRRRVIGDTAAAQRRAELVDERREPFRAVLECAWRHLDERFAHAPDVPAIETGVL
jgi:hypothetical protein